MAQARGPLVTVQRTPTGTARGGRGADPFPEGVPAGAGVGGVRWPTVQASPGKEEAAWRTPPPPAGRWGAGGAPGKLSPGQV